MTNGPNRLPGRLRTPFVLLATRASVNLDALPGRLATLYVLAQAIMNPATVISRQNSLTFGELLGSLRMVGIADENDDMAREVIAGGMTHGWLSRPGFTTPHVDQVGTALVAPILPASHTLDDLTQGADELAGAAAIDRAEAEEIIQVVQRGDLHRLVNALRRYEAGELVFVGDDEEPAVRPTLLTEQDIFEMVASPYENAADTYMRYVRRLINGLGLTLDEQLTLLRGLVRELRASLGGSPTTGWLASTPAPATPVDSTVIAHLAGYIMQAGDLVAGVILGRLETVYNGLVRHIASPPAEEIADDGDPDSKR